MLMPPWALCVIRWTLQCRPPEQPGRGSVCMGRGEPSTHIALATVQDGRVVCGFGSGLS